MRTHPCSSGMPGQGLVALVWPPLMVLWPLLLLRPHPMVLGLPQPLPLPPMLMRPPPPLRLPLMVLRPPPPPCQHPKLLHLFQRLPLPLMLMRPPPPLRAHSKVLHLLQRLPLPLMLMRPPPPLRPPPLVLRLPPMWRPPPLPPCPPAAASARVRVPACRLPLFSLSCCSCLAVYCPRRVASPLLPGAAELCCPLLLPFPLLPPPPR